MIMCLHLGDYRGVKLYAHRGEIYILFSLDKTCDPYTVESPYSDHVCLGQIDHYEQMIMITDFFLQITIKSTSVYLLHQYEVMKWTLGDTI